MDTKAPLTAILFVDRCASAIVADLLRANKTRVDDGYSVVGVELVFSSDTASSLGAAEGRAGDLVPLAQVVLEFEVLG